VIQDKIELVSIEESPIYQDSIWVNIIMPEDEERAMSELAAEISTDMLTDYGYDIMISPAA
jgi:phosphoenolpyruvate synthase/pyruvate phosphate dikinase